MPVIRRCVIRGILGAIGGILLGAALTTSAFAADPDIISGKLPDGTFWGVAKPANWNGTLILDLDGASVAPGGGNGAAAAPRANPFRQWQFAKGFAVGGTTREPVSYDFAKAVDNLVSVRRLFIDKYGTPKRTLVTGASRGAFAARKALEQRPDIFAGGLVASGGGIGHVARQRNTLNVTFTLKTLVDPGAPLKLVNVDEAVETAALNALIAKAASTPQGRARLALAAAYMQFPMWSSRTKPKPGPTDYDAAVDQMVNSLAEGVGEETRAGLERVNGGNISWNTDADYTKLLDRSGRRPMVEALYKEAGLDLNADLAILAKTPRIKADPAAVARAEKNTTWTGKIKGPIVNVDNDDVHDSAVNKMIYRDLLKRVGTVNQFMMLWSDTPTHGNIAAIDRAVAFTYLLRKLDTGSYGDTSLAAQKALASELSKTTPDLGKSNLFDPGPLPAALNTWDASNWGTYK